LNELFWICVALWVITFCAVALFIVALVATFRLRKTLNSVEDTLKNVNESLASLTADAKKTMESTGVFASEVAAITSFIRERLFSAAKVTSALAKIFSPEIFILILSFAKKFLDSILGTPEEEKRKRVEQGKDSNREQ